MCWQDEFVQCKNAQGGMTALLLLFSYCLEIMECVRKLIIILPIKLVQLITIIKKEIQKPTCFQILEADIHWWGKNMCF